MKKHTLVRVVAIIGLALAYFLVKGLERLFGSRVWLVLVVAAAVLGFAVRFGACDLGGPVRVGTYNIRRFGVEDTDVRRLVRIIASTRADVLAIQEIQSEERLGDLARRLSTSGREVKFVLSRCGGKSEMRVGFLYDASRVTLKATREFPELSPDERGHCEGDRPGLVGTFSRRKDGAPFQLLVFHLAAGGDLERVEMRKTQWRRAYKIAASVRAAGPVMILGDANSTGYLDDKGGERTFIDEEARRADMTVETSALGCSEYYQPDPPAIRPSLLDHVVTMPELTRSGSARVHGFCAELACKPSRSPPGEFETVSDHCPVTVDLR